MSFIKELSNFLRLKMQLNRVVSGDFIMKLATMAQPPTGLTPRLIIGCIRCQAVGEEVRGMLGTCLTNGDVAKIKANPGLAQEAEVLMNRAREVLEQQSIVDVGRVGEFDVSIVKFVCGKVSKNDPKVYSMEDLIADFIRQVVPALANPASASASTSTSAPISGDIVEYND